MIKKNIPVNVPLFIGNEQKYLRKCIDTGWIGSDGKYVKEFENKLSKFVNRKYSIAVSSGSAALDIAFKALELKKDDEVILPSFTIISCLNPIIKCGAKPIFIDVEPQTWNMNLELIEKNITKKTRVILAVHIYGIPVNMPKLLKLAKKYRLKVIEDASEQIGQTINGSQCGSFGDISTFSFYTNKHITTGEGGMIFTNNKLLKNKCLSLRNLYFDNARRFVHEEIGWNYRMSNLQAAVGLAQFENIKKIVKLKRDVGIYYYKLLKGLKKIKFQSIETDYAKNIFWVVGIVLKKDGIIDKIRKDLLKRGIQTRSFFWPLHKQPLLNKYKIKKQKKLKNTEYISKNGFYLPSGLALKKADIKYVCDSLKEILAKYS